MGRLRVKAPQCNYQENNRCLKKYFINRIDDDMRAEIIKGLTTIKDTSTITSELLSWLKQIEVQRSQTAMTESLKEKKNFDIINKSKSHNYSVQWQAATAKQNSRYYQAQPQEPTFANTVGQATYPDNAQHMPKHAENAERQTYYEVVCRSTQRQTSTNPRSRSKTVLNGEGDRRRQSHEYSKYQST